MDLHPFEVHVVDGTYELFRYHFGPSNRDPEFGATRGVLGSMVQLLEDGATHVGVATDHVVESFRNDLWPGYKTSAGMPPELLAQFPLVEDVLSAAGFAVWPQTEYEAVRAHARRYLVALDHENPEIERVVSQNAHFAVVETFVGEASRIAEETDPRTT